MVDAFAAQQDAYLDFATEKPLDPGNPLSVVAHAEQATRDTSFTFDPSVVTPDAYADMFAGIDAFEDTTDFDLLYLINLWYGYGDQLPQDTATRSSSASSRSSTGTPSPRRRASSTTSTTGPRTTGSSSTRSSTSPARPSPTRRSRTTAAPARSTRETAEARIRDWLDEKVRFGFTEWHSDVYYQKDVTPLLTLVEFAPDDDLANRAAMVLDLVLLDIALHLQKGNFGATHGRSYMKDKSTALDQDTFALAKLLFDDTSEPYQSPAPTRARRCSPGRRSTGCPTVIRAHRDERRADDRHGAHERAARPARAGDARTPNRPYGYRVRRPRERPVLVGAGRADGVADRPASRSRRSTSTGCGTASSTARSSRCADAGRRRLRRRAARSRRAWRRCLTLRAAHRGAHLHATARAT